MFPVFFPHPSKTLKSLSFPRLMETLTWEGCIKPDMLSIQSARLISTLIVLVSGWDIEVIKSQFWLDSGTVRGKFKISNRSIKDLKRMDSCSIYNPQNGSFPVALKLERIKRKLILFLGIECPFHQVQSQTWLRQNTIPNYRFRSCCWWKISIEKYLIQT